MILPSPSITYTIAAIPRTLFLPPTSFTHVLPLPFVRGPLFPARLNDSVHEAMKAVKDFEWVQVQENARVAPSEYDDFTGNKSQVRVPLSEDEFNYLHPWTKFESKCQLQFTPPPPHTFTNGDLKEIVLSSALGEPLLNLPFCVEASKYFKSEFGVTSRLHTSGLLFNDDASSGVTGVTVDQRYSNVTKSYEYNVLSNLKLTAPAINKITVNLIEPKRSFYNRRMLPHGACKSSDKFYYDKVMAFIHSSLLLDYETEVTLCSDVKRWGVDEDQEKETFQKDMDGLCKSWMSKDEKVYKVGVRWREYYFDE